MANTVLCAIDLGPSTTRVVSHAAYPPAVMHDY